MNSGKSWNFIEPSSKSDGAIFTTRCGGRTDCAPSMSLGAAWTLNMLEPSTVVLDACHLQTMDSGEVASPGSERGAVTCKSSSIVKGAVSYSRSCCEPASSRSKEDALSTTHRDARSHLEVLDEHRCFYGGQDEVRSARS